MAEEVVRVVYQLGGIREAQQGAEGLAGSLDHSERAARGSASAFSALTSSLTSYLGFRALAGDARQAASALIGLSSDAEDTRIAIAGMLQAGGAAGLSGSAEDFSRYMSISADVMAKIRKDARELPGEAEDLVNVFRGALQGGLEGGKSVLDIEGLSARMMAVSKVLQIPSEVAGREMQMMMEGRAGAHNALWQRLKNNIGASAEEFNAFSAAEKWDRIDKALKGYDPAIKEFAKTWSAVSSTAVDYAKTLVRLGGEPVFKEMKTILAEIGAYYEQHQEQIDAMVQSLGGELADAVRSTWGYAKDVLGWMLNHRGEIRALLESIAVAKIATSIGGGIGGLAGGGGVGKVTSGLAVEYAALHGIAAMIDAVQERGVGVQTDAGAFSSAWKRTNLRDVMGSTHELTQIRALAGDTGVLSPDQAEMQQAIANRIRNETSSMAAYAREWGAIGPNGADRGVIANRLSTMFSGDPAQIGQMAAQMAVMVDAFVTAQRAASAGTPGAAGDLTKTVSPPPQHKTNITNYNRFETKIDAADNPDRVYSDLKRAVRDAQLFPKESAVGGGGVLR